MYALIIRGGLKILLVGQDAPNWSRRDVIACEFEMRSKKI